MSSIGRIFLVITFALAAMVVGASSALLGKTESYRFKYEEQTASYDSLVKQSEEELRDLEQQKAAAERLKSQAVQARQALEVEKQRLADDIAALTDEKAQLQGSVEGMTSKLADIQTVIDQATEKADDRAEKQIAAIEARDKAMNEAAAAQAAQAEAEDRANGLATQVAQLEERLAGTSDTLALVQTQLQTALERSNLTLADIGAVAPPIDGAVVAVTQQDGAVLVHLNRGESDGVKPGYKFDIYSPSTQTYKGQATVEIVNAGSATAVMTLKSDSPVAQGDRASTLLTKI